jgi:uncharacterized surface protein with fasciclin (FAS1) repeats
MNLHVRFSLLLITVAALVVAGCDQSEQNLDFTPGDTYIITQNTSASGDAGLSEVSVPDTVSYRVQGYTIDKDYTWTVGGTELPTLADNAPESHVWETRGGEFATVLYGDDPIASFDPDAEVVNDLQIDASPDDIDPQVESVATAVRDSLGSQVARFAGFSTLATLATDSEVLDVINDESLTLTLLAPDNAAFGGLATVPTNAVDEDEPASSSMLFDFLAYHAIDGEFASGDITNGASVPTLLPGETAGSSSEVEFQVTSSGITANDGPAVTQADIPATNGVAHKINGVLIPPIASVDFTDQPVEDDSVETAPGVFAPADSVTVQGAFLPEGGFVVLHDSTALADQGAIPSIVGVSEYLEPGISTDIKVPIDNVSNTATIGAMAHEDSNDNESYDFSTSGGLEDGPYTRDGDAVIDNGEVSSE